MQLSMKYLKGVHDFSSFRSSGCQASNPVRNVSDVSLAKNKGVIVFSITANAFLYHMVRNIAGTLVDIGLKKIRPKDLHIIMSEKNRKYCSKMAPPHALFLWCVSYPQKYKISYNTESILL